jgi:hypothetical protein
MEIFIMGSIFREKDPIRNAVDTLSVPRPRARAGRCGARHLPVCQGDSRQHRRQDHARLIAQKYQRRVWRGYAHLCATASNSK